jgi:hypothetical protein
MTTAARAAWSANDTAAVVAAASDSPVARLASHESAATCTPLTTSLGLGTGSLLDFRLQEDHMRMVISC